MAIRIILADDHKIIRDGISSLLKDEKTIQVIGEVANGEELLNVLALTQPNLVLMDVNMPKLDGYEATLRIASLYPQVQVLVLSMLDHEKYVNRMLTAGASGYLLKSTGREELIQAIQAVAAGQQYIGSEIALGLLRKAHLEEDNLEVEEEVKTKPVGELSKRELEVLKLIAEGLTNNEIATRLFTSKRTVETHRKNLIAKTGAKNTAALIRYALAQGII